MWADPGTPGPSEARRPRGSSGAAPRRAAATTASSCGQDLGSRGGGGGQDLKGATICGHQDVLTPEYRGGVVSGPEGHERYIVVTRQRAAWGQDLKGRGQLIGKLGTSSLRRPWLQACAVSVQLLGNDHFVDPLPSRSPFVTKRRGQPNSRVFSNTQNGERELTRHGAAPPYR